MNYESIDKVMQALGIHSNRDASLEMSCMQVTPNEEFEAYPGISHTREAIMEYICEKDIQRPLQNIA